MLNRLESSGIFLNVFMNTTAERNFLMRLLTLMPIALVLLIGCKAASETTPQVIDPKVAEKMATEVEAKINNSKPGDAMSPRNKDGSAKPHFPDNGIVGLNAIVKQAYDAIERYDDQRKTIREAVASAKGATPDSPTMQKAKAAIAEVEKLHSMTRDSKAKITTEGAKLVSNQQYYNIEIFGGMTLFIDRVVTELGEEFTNLTAALKAK